MKAILKFLGIESNTTSHAEKWVSAVGGFTGILITISVCSYYLGSDAYFVVASLGASAILVFALPHVSVSQPWSLVAGQVISAIVGVSCAKAIIAEPVLAAALAVGGSILVMYYLRCIHPPGGATALAAVIGGPNLHALGYEYVVTPILVNALLLLLLAIIINFAFKWRRYPVYLSKLLEKTPAVKEDNVSMFTSEDLQDAMKQLDLYFDVSEEDLTRLVNLAMNHYKKSHLLPSEIRLGRCYSNGMTGDELEIRQIVDESASYDAIKDKVIFKVVSDQKQSTSSAVITRVQFAKWAKYEVRRLTDGGWEKVG
ncbi:MAG: HPP family protein [Gammaproteobacteria bacterium]|nr:HPP family protein [Gammaproteobacteria bacterium]